MEQSSSLVLVVDDNATNTKVLFDLLRSTGLRVLVAKNGESALERLQSVTPDLILLDVMMPGIDGFETCRRLKKMEPIREVPVIFMTALSDTVDKVTGLSLGAVDYVTKPFDREEVLARINLHLELYQLRQKLEQRVAERTAELAQSQQQLQQSQLQVVQSEKMSALGNLVAGVAHEINNPVSFIVGNIAPALEYVDSLLELIGCYQQEYPQHNPTIQQKIDAIDLEYIREDLPKLICSMKQGTDRICNISTSLRIFSRADADRPQPFNLHEGIDSTLLILRHRLKADQQRPEIEVTKHYGDLPLVNCYPGQLNQVFMNLLANAIDALEELNQGHCLDEIKQHPNRILIVTTADDTHVTIQIKDNGTGMAAEVQQRIFDSNFTTKAVGKGTGLGLAIAHQIIVEKHRGQLTCTSIQGEGTEFVVKIPLNE